VTLMSVKSK